MRLKADLVIRQMGDEYVIVKPNQQMRDFSKVFTLNESAVFVWKSIHKREFTETFIVKLLMNKYDVQEAEARADVRKMIENFTIHDFLEK